MAGEPNLSKHSYLFFSKRCDRGRLGFLFRQSVKH